MLFTIWFNEKKARKAPNFKKETKKRKYISLLHEIKRKISFRKMKQRQSGITTTDPKVDFRTVQKRWRHRVRKMKPTNFTNACQFRRVNFWHLLQRQGNLAIQWKFCTVEQARWCKIPTVIKQERLWSYPPTCRQTEISLPTFVVCSPLHHLNFKGILPKCVFQN